MKHYNIPIFVPHRGCPFDCIFCNQKHITGKNFDVNENDVKRIIKEHLITLPKNSDDCIIEAAFFGGSFTGIDFDVQGKLLSAAYEFVLSGDISGIRLSTRPDYIDKRILDQLKKYSVTTIELGVQSLDDNVLKVANRGHTSEDVFNAVKLIKEYGFTLGLQMMTGLPTDTDEGAKKTADKIISLRPDFVRIYPTLVVKDTYLEKMYQNGEYIPPTLNNAVELCADLLEKFNDANINVIRVALQTTDEISPHGSIVAGPFDSQFRELVESKIYFDKFQKALRNLKYKNPVIFVNPKEISKAIGQKRMNLIKLLSQFGVSILIKPCVDVKKGDFIISDGVESEG